MAEATYILTYRDGDGAQRRENLFAVLRWLARYPQFDVLVVEQDAVPRLDVLPHPTARVVFGYNPGPFNKSWGYNLGFRHTRASILAFGDADVIVGDVLPDALAHARGGGHFVKPYRRLIDLDETETARVRGGDVDWFPERSADAPRDREAAGEYIVLAGGLFLIARGAFVHLGGWDERFRGWGGEDDAFSYRIERARLPGVELDRGPAVHLHHARPAANTLGQPHYAANRALLADYRALDDDQLVRFAEIQAQAIGRRDKYQPA